MNMAKPKIFFSYSRADGSAFALRLAVDLKKKGFNVWIDQQDIRAGLEWDTEIEKALETCDCVLFVETEKSVVSNNVLDEVYYALEQNKKVIPLIYVDSRTPFRLNRLQHIDFTKNYDTGLALLVKELECITPDFVNPPQEKAPVTNHNKPFYNKKSAAIVIIACLAVLITVVIVRMVENKHAASAGTAAATSLTDTTTNKTGDVTNQRNTGAIDAEGENDGESKGKVLATEANTKNEGKKASVGPATANAGHVDRNPESNTSSLNEMVAGDWRLSEIEPKAQSQRGYLKIEALDENKATIKSYMQFYYPDSKASSYLTIFNAFAGCTSCVVNKEIKLNVEDIAIGSRTVKKLQEDQADGKKAGDVILDANANKSVRGTATLQFIDNNHAVITVTQPLSIALANDFMLEPFVYTFRFKKND
jgi:hypothetical protein